MPEVAFFFDVDGVLVNSHQFQAIAIRESLEQIAADHCLKVQLPSLEIIEVQLVGGTEARALARITELVPALAMHMSAVVSLAWQKYYKLIQENPKEFAIQSTVTLLRTLYEIGHIVCLVSNSKVSDVRAYCKLLNLEFILEDRTMIVGAEDFSAPKPSPDPYLVAIDRFQVLPSCCVVFEDSVLGILAARAASTHVIALKSNHIAEDELLEAGAKEVVENLWYAKDLVRHAYTPAAYNLEEPDKFRFQVVTIQDQPLTVQKDIVDQTFEVYKLSFAGRSKTQWHEKLCDKRDLSTRIGLLMTRDYQIVGYLIFKVRVVTYEHDDRSIFLVSAGSTASARGNRLILNFAQSEVRRYLISSPQLKSHLVDNFLGPAGYTFARRCLKDIKPSPASPRPSNEDQRYLQFLARSLGYMKADVSDPDVYISASQLGNRIISSDENPIQRMFTERVKNQRHGLYCIASCALDNLEPMESIAPRGAKKCRNLSLPRI